MHQKEAKHQKTGTGHLSHLSLVNSELIVGVDFTENKRVNEIINDPNLFPLVLYPGSDALTAQSAQLKTAVVANRTPAVFVIDATWFCAKKIMDKSLNLQKLPKISFLGNYTSIFTFKREPRPECVSTIESCYYLIKEMQKEGLSPQNKAENNPEPLMTVFKEMIRYQLESENRRIILGLPSRHGKDDKYQTIKEIPDYLITDVHVDSWNDE